MLAWYRKVVLIACGCVLVFASGKVRAQEELFSVGFQLGTGTRAISMGGAYVSQGGDYASSFWNPAGLADIRRIEFYGTFTHLQSQNNMGLSGSDIGFETTEGFTKLNDFGLAYAVPTVRGSLVLSFGFNRIKTFDSNFAFEWFNPTGDDLVNQAWSEYSNGSLNAWILSGAVDVSPNMSVGLGMNFWTGGEEFSSAFREVDIDDIYTFDRFDQEQTLDNKISGFNLKLGSILKFGEAFRLGAAVGTPINFTVEEEWTNFEETNFDDNTFSDSTESGFFEYKIRSPWNFSVGASLSFLNFLVSGDIEYNDWTNIQYNSEPPFADLTQAEANRIIREQYRATTRLRLGGEFTLPMTGLSFRAGYFKDPSIYKNSDLDEDKQFLSAGIGFLVDKQVKLDVGLVHGFWKRFNNGLSGTDDIGAYVEDIKTYEGLVSLAFRF